MTQRNEVLTREDNRISLISTTRATTPEDYLTIAEGELPISTRQQTWEVEVGQETSVGRKNTKLASTLVKLIEWLNRLGSGRIDDGYLESRHNTHDNPRIKGTGLW
jgi:hypothetical protein